jgi:regulator of sigma E protease
VVEVWPGSPADLAGIRVGDEIERIDGREPTGAQDAREAVRAAGDGGVVFLLKRAEERLEVSVTGAGLEGVGDGTQKYVGVGLLEAGIVSYPWYLAPVKGAETTVFYVASTLAAFGDLIGDLWRRQGVSVELSGPVGIAAMTGEVAELGWVYLLQFTALLSVNLAMLNALPFPALDGGRMVFVVLEVLRGGRRARAVEAWVHSIGFAVLMGLVILVTYRDVIKLFE